MFVSVSDGRKFKVQFVHSSHDGKRAVASPGGLRQFVDNLAASLNRRVSFCEISEIDTKVVNGEPVTGFVALSQGFALCHHKDQFNKRTGRAYCLDRALLNSGLSYLAQDEIWDALFGNQVPRPCEFY